MTTEGERREHILAVAERLLRHYGPQKTTMAEIARAAEVGVGTVYLEFPSKEAIVEELSRERHASVLAAMRQALTTGRTFGDRIRAVFDARLDAFLKLEAEGAHARDLVHCMNPAVRTAQAHFKEAELDLLRQLLREGEQAGDFALDTERGSALDATATAVLLAYVSFAPPFVFGADPAELERRMAAMHSVVLYGLVRRDSPRGKRR